MSRQGLIEAQAQDPLMESTIQAVNCGKWPDNPEALPMKREKGKLIMIHGLLHRVSTSRTGENIYQLVLPNKFKATVLKSMHDDLGHLGVDRVVDMIRPRFFWPKMSADVEEYVKNCGESVLRKTQCQRAAPLHQIVSSGPLDLVCIDFLSMEPDSRGMSNVLIFTDPLTQDAQAFPTQIKRLSQWQRFWWKGFFVHYGLPSRIHSGYILDSRDFESRLIKELLKILGIAKSRTTPYPPQGDPQPERFNRMLLSVLATLSQEKKRQWSQHVVHLVHA